MRQLTLFLLVLFICGSAMAQSPNVNYQNVIGTLYRAVSNGTTTTYTLLQGRTLGATTDTTLAITIQDYKTIYLSLEVKDTATVLVDYSTSLDDSAWTTYTLIDSVSIQAAAGGHKLIDMTTTLKGAKSVRFRFRGDANAFAMGNAATFKARYLLKKY